MDFFKRVRNWVGLTAPRPNALEFSTLGNLPIDIIYHISRLLPPESAASFSICCRPLYFALDTQYLEDLRPMEEFIGMRRERFLKLLERDLPDHIICSFCQKLHAMNKPRRYRHSNYDYYIFFKPPKCWKMDEKSQTSANIHHEFSSSVFEMTIKRYRQGLEYSDLLHLLSLDTEIHLNYWRWAQQQTATAKLIDGCLFIREQKANLIPATKANLLKWDPIWKICPHATFWVSKDLSRYLGDLRVSSWRTQKGYLNGGQLVRCKYCRSEYQVDIKEFGSRGTIVYITKWLDLGQGPLEYNCRSHLNNADGLPRQQIEFDTGSIRAAFEGSGQSDFDSDAIIHSKDREKLFKKFWLFGPGPYDFVPFLILLLTIFLMVAVVIFED